MTEPKAGDLYITLPDHSQRDGDYWNPSETLVFVRYTSDSKTLAYFTSKDRPELRQQYVTMTRVKRVEPVIERIIKARNRLDLIFD